MKQIRSKVILVFIAIVIGATTVCLISAPATGPCWCSAIATGFTSIATPTEAQPLPVDLHRFLPVPELPAQPELPDPLVMLDGRRVTTRDQWCNERRPELLALFQHYMYGFLPPAPKETAGKIVRVDRTVFGGRATIKEVIVTFGPPQLPPIHLMLVIPNRREVPAPVILGMNY